MTVAICDMGCLRIDTHLVCMYPIVVNSASSTSPCILIRRAYPSYAPYGRVWEAWLRTKDLCKALAVFV
jgi:hypothetical protein